MPEPSEPTLPFTFRYDRFGNPALYFGGAIAGLVLANDVSDVTDPRAWAINAGLLAWAVVVYFAIVWAVPPMPDGKRVSVDVDGLRLARLHLPAERIAEVVVVDGEKATRQLFRLRSLIVSDYAIDGRRIRWTRFVYAWSTRTAVLVRDRDGDHKPWWLLTTPKDLDVPAFVRALHAASPHLDSATVPDTLPLPSDPTPDPGHPRGR